MWKNILVTRLGRDLSLLIPLSLILALAVNMLRPNGLPVYQDWSKLTRERYGSGGVLELAEALKLWQDGAAVFVDARDGLLYRKEHIAGAVSVPFDPADPGFRARAEALPKDALLVLYCSNLACPLAHELAEYLKGLGVTRVAIMPDGIHGWREIDAPLESGGSGS